jgi:hypothetical protein
MLSRNPNILERLLPIGIVDWPPNRPKSGPDFNTIPLEAPVLAFRGFFVASFFFWLRQAPPNGGEMLLVLPGFAIRKAAASGARSTAPDWWELARTNS